MISSPSLERNGDQRAHNSHMLSLNRNIYIELGRDGGCLQGKEIRLGVLLMKLRKQR